MTEKLPDRIVNFFGVNDIDEYIVRGKKIHSLREIAKRLDGHVVGSYRLCATGRVCYDSETDRFSTKIERDKL